MQKNQNKKTYLRLSVLFKSIGIVSILLIGGGALSSLIFGVEDMNPDFWFFSPISWLFEHLSFVVVTGIIAVLLLITGEIFEYKYRKVYVKK